MRDEFLDLIDEAIGAHEECHSKVSQIMEEAEQLEGPEYEKLKKSIEAKASQFVNFNSMLKDIMSEIESLPEESEDDED